MSTQNLFEIAARQRLRFETKVGLLSVEDLWSLPLTSKSKASLDEVAISLKKQISESNQSFVETVSTTDRDLEVKFELVKYIISVRLQENQAKLEQQANADKRELLRALIERKKGEELGSKSVEELEALLQATGS